MLHKFYWFLALNVLYILAFVYNGFYEITFFYNMYIFNGGKTIKEKERKRKSLEPPSLVWGTPLPKSSDLLTKWSYDKFKTIFLHFHNT